MHSSSSHTYDAVVVGSGLGGMTTANRLARAGHRVLLLEHHHRLGGLATWFKRKGHIFDISLHGFPHGMVKTCKKYWNRAITESIVQLEEIVFDNPQFSLKTSFDKEDFNRLLQDHFGIERAVIDKFFSHVSAMNFYDDQRQTTRELFEDFFPGRSDVHRLLMEPITYANGSTLDDPAISYGIVFSNFMSKGVFTFKGGTDRLIGLMKEELEENGVEIRTRARVSQIVVEQGEVAGVVVDDSFIGARSVISNGDIVQTIDEMVGPTHFDHSFLRRHRGVRVNNSSCQVYIGIAAGEKIDPIGDLIFFSHAPQFDSAELLDFATRSKTFSIYYPKTRPGHDRYTIVASMNADYDAWHALSPSAYEEAKQAMMEQTVTDLCRYIPDVREKIDWLEAATPLTFKRYTLHTGGTSFGTKFEGLDISRSLHKHIGGLFHVGSVGIIMSGWLGAINYGVIVANDVDAYLRACH
jgi:phytoene dehydrogenase-like protein